MVREGCPLACDFCGSEVTNAPTQSHVTSKQCEDNSGYQYDMDARHTCAWVRRKFHQELCLEDAVILNCPYTCGDCCEDDPNYKLTTGAGKEKSVVG